MENNEGREFVVIVHLTEDLARKLNVNNAYGKNYGLECKCDCECEVLELNKDDPQLHANIASRVFCVKADNLQPNTKCEVFMEDRTGEEKKKIATVSFVIPYNREFEIVELVDYSEILTDEVLKLFRK